MLAMLQIPQTLVRLLLLLPKQEIHIDSTQQISLRKATPELAGENDLVHLVNLETPRKKRPDCGLVETTTAVRICERLSRKNSITNYGRNSPWNLEQSAKSAQGKPGASVNTERDVATTPEA